MTNPLCEEQPDFPAIMVEAAFAGGAPTADYLHLDDIARGIIGTATLGPDDVWENISEWVHRVATNRGVDRITSPVIKYEAGTAGVDLNNSDRRFDPTNLSGPYVSAGVTQITPMRAIRIRAVWKGVTYDLMRPFADEWKIDYEGADYSLCRLLATDAMKVLKGNDRIAVSAVGAGENAGARVTRILNSASWSASDRVIAVGDTTLQATTLEGPAWTELQLVAETEIGEVYVDGAGRVVFRNRQSALESMRSLYANALFGGNAVTGVTTTINLVTNPSIETDTAGWGAGGSVPPTLSQSSAQALFGTKSLLATWGTGGVLPLFGYIPTGVTVGKTYTMSVYVFVPTGSPDVVIVSSTQGFGDSTSLKDQWVRLTYTGVVIPGWAMQIWPLTPPTAGQQCYADGFQVEEGFVVTTYCDGAQASSEWDGAAHASSSRRLPELPAADVTLDYTDATIANMVRVTRVGGTEQVAQDAASQQLNLIRTHKPSTDLLMQTDAVALDYAGFLLHQTKDPELRLTSFVILPQADPDNLYPLVLGLDFGDRIRITYNPPGGGTITREVFIRGITHSIEQGKWITVFTLQSAARWSFMVLDHNTLGKIGENALGF